ncbi:MAG TPA: hotdog domain-containing protein [Thermoanaerobaculia bacterium]|nr:hotdog domain-containing protein [Thermoanaerobaculia bacterium]
MPNAEPAVHTHLGIDRRLCGRPLEVGEGAAVVAFEALPEMAADDRGLLHGGFVFGLADYAAMLAVDHPHVVLGSAEVRFLKPVTVGERLEARAAVEETDGRKSRVRVEVRRTGETAEAVMAGTFLCFTLERHVLDVRDGGGKR